MSSRSNNKTWSYREVQRSVVYVRFLLGTLRECFIAAWHHHRLIRRDPTATASHDLTAVHRREGIAALEELQRLGVIPYQSPLRGIALFPFQVEAKRQDGSTESRTAFWVYKDSRDEIDSFVFAEDVFDKELLGVERAVPEEWKELPVGQMFFGPKGERQ